MLAFLCRIGGPLIEPRAAMRRAVDAPAGRGAADVTIVVLLAWVGEQLPGLVHAFFRARELGIGSGLQSILMLLRAILPIALGILVAALAMSVLAGRKSGRGSSPAGSPPRADAVDLSAYSALPFVLVTGSADLVIGLIDRPPPPAVSTAVLAVGFAWSLVLWLIALASRGSEP